MSIRRILTRHRVRPEEFGAVERRRITPEYIQFLEDIGASRDLIEFAQKHVEPAEPQGPPAPRSSGVAAAG